MKSGVFSMLAVAMAAVATLAAPAFSADPHWPETLNIATGSPGGTYHVYGARLARILTRVLGLPVGERTTGGPSQNIQLIESGDAQLARPLNTGQANEHNGNAIRRC